MQKASGGMPHAAFSGELPREDASHQTEAASQKTVGWGILLLKDSKHVFFYQEQQPDQSGSVILMLASLLQWTDIPLGVLDCFCLLLNVHYTIDLRALGLCIFSFSLAYQNRLLGCHHCQIASNLLHILPGDEVD